ncbi:MAG: fasciclin domain-containing protein [Halobacteriota archaeon]
MALSRIVKQVTKLKFNVDIATVVTQADELSTFLKAAISADLVDTLKGQSPLTIFAPDNEAFSNVPAGTLDSLLNDKERLTSVLTYHVVAGKHLAADLAKQKTLLTVQGGMLEVQEHHWLRHGIKINDAVVKDADIECTNGVIHIIDAVLMPE